MFLGLQEALHSTDKDLRLSFEGVLRPSRIGIGSESGEERLWSAIRYAVMGGGKRIRPFMALEFGNLFSVSRSVSMRVAMAVEFIHCYSLVHDDLPCMDDDDFRRGRASLHVEYDYATAVLAGDALQTLAFETLLDSHENPHICLRLLRGMASAVGADGMVGGQMIDMQVSSGLEEGSISTVTRLQRLKTGCLFEFSCEAAAILGQVGDDSLGAVKGYARDLGLAFQMTDDLLDIEGGVEVTGKSGGKDRLQNKGTWVGLLGVEKTRVQAGLLCEQAIEYLSGFDGRADLLRDLARYVPNRKN